MPLPSSIVGTATEAIEHTVDARWTMAYAAGIADLAGVYLDTIGRDMVAHPLFPVCLEWPVVLAARGLVPRDQLPRFELVRGVHATHDLRIHRLARPGDVLSTTATIEGVERRSPGAYEVLRLDTIDALGAPVATTRMGTLFLGVDVVGADRPAPDDGVEPDGEQTWPDVVSIPRSIDGGAAHIYTECARIWNPIHTDPAVAAAAGLPGIILHGTATLAMAVSEIVHRMGSGDPTRVRRIGGRFAAMVELPSTIEVQILGSVPTFDGSGATQVVFEVLNDIGETAIRAGYVVLDPAPPS